MSPLTPGQEVPIRYDPAKPGHPYYAGPWGDIYSPWPAPGYLAGSVLVILTGASLLTGASRLIGITRAAVADVTTPVRLREVQSSWPGYVVRTDRLVQGYSLTWLVPDRLPDTAGDVRILGKPAGGRWLIIRLPDGRLVWPASKAEPALELATPRLPVVEPGPLGAVHLLLASYTRVIDLVDALPLAIRYEPKTDWVWLGALRPVVKSLVTLHLRRRLAALGTALLRAALLSNDDSNHQYRHMLADASDECRTFARTLPRRGLLVVLATLATIAATGLSIVSPFLVLPHIQLSGHVVTQHILLFVAALLICVLIFGVAAPLIFFRSVRYKRALFSPASVNSDRQRTESAASMNYVWDVYHLEHVAFAAFETAEPNEWESKQSIRWLIGALYLAAIAIPLACIYTSLTLSILGGSATLLAFATAWKWQRRVRAAQASPDQAISAADTPPAGG